MNFTFPVISRKESLAALQEAIKLAQESNDHVCLQHALVSDYPMIAMYSVM